MCLCGNSTLLHMVLQFESCAVWRHLRALPSVHISNMFCITLLNAQQCSGAAMLHSGSPARSQLNGKPVPLASEQVSCHTYRVSVEHNCPAFVGSFLF